LFEILRLFYVDLYSNVTSLFSIEVVAEDVLLTISVAEDVVLTMSVAEDVVLTMSVAEDVLLTMSVAEDIALTLSFVCKNCVIFVGDVFSEVVVDIVIKGLVVAIQVMLREASLAIKQTPN